MTKHKINRKITLLAITGILFLSFIPAAAAYRGRGKTNIRPIEDWLAAVPPGAASLGGSPFIDEGLLLLPLLDAWEPMFHWDSAMNYNPEGFVFERALKDNILLVTVNMRLKGIPFHIVTFDPSSLVISFIPIFSGVLDFIYQLKFTIDLDTLGHEDYNDNGNIIYKPWNYYVYFLRNAVSVFLCTHGSGTFLSSYGDWEEGDTVKMNTINFIVIVGEDYTGSHPYYNILGLNEILLVDRINFH